MNPEAVTSQLEATSAKAVEAFRKLGEKMRPLVTSPKKGETFKLVEALKPTVITLEVCKALSLAYPPVLLTYVGQESGATVRSQFNL